jgi:hypothetical protein
MYGRLVYFYIFFSFLVCVDQENSGKPGPQALSKGTEKIANHLRYLNIQLKCGIQLNKGKQQRRAKFRNVD